MFLVGQSVEQTVGAPIDDGSNPEWEGEPGILLRGSEMCSREDQIQRHAVWIHETRVIGGWGEVMHVVRIRERMSASTAGGRWSETLWWLGILRGCIGSKKIF